MAVITYDGVKTEDQQTGSLYSTDNLDSKPVPIYDPHNVTAALHDTPQTSGPVTQNDHDTPTVINLDGVDVDYYPKHSVRGSIYYDLAEIDLFITEDSFHTLKIWNAYESIKTITSITVDSVAGTDLAPIETPKGLADGWYYPFQFTVYESGPPVQDTTYTFTIGGEEFTTRITGIRILPFLYPINWDSNYKLTLAHNTVVEKNEIFREQRRPLQARTFKSVDVSILLKDVIEHDYFYDWICLWIYFICIYLT